MPIAQTSFAAPDDRIIHKGDEVSDKDPVLKGREHLFEWDAPTTRKPHKRTAKRTPSTK